MHSLQFLTHKRYFNSHKREYYSSLLWLGGEDQRPNRRAWGFLFLSSLPLRSPSGPPGPFVLICRHKAGNHKLEAENPLLQIQKPWGNKINILVWLLVWGDLTDWYNLWWDRQLWERQLWRPLGSCPLWIGAAVHRDWWKQFELKSGLQAKWLGKQCCYQ